MVAKTLGMLLLSIYVAGCFTKMCLDLCDSVSCMVEQSTGVCIEYSIIDNNLRCHCLLDPA